MNYRRVVLRESTDFWLGNKGTWRKAPDKVTNQVTVKASCPTCGAVASLDNHSIAHNGDVSPSLICPSGECDFHDMVTLHGWAG